MSTEGYILQHTLKGAMLAVRRQKGDSSENPHCDIKAGSLADPQVNKLVPFMDYEITKERDLQMDLKLRRTLSMDIKSLY